MFQYRVEILLPECFLDNDIARIQCIVSKVFYFFSPAKKKKGVDHKESLEKLKSKDPEFYEFLKQEDKSLLDFNASDDSGETTFLFT